MEKKRKLPPRGRAALRQESSSKHRTITPETARPSTPSSDPFTGGLTANHDIQSLPNSINTAQPFPSTRDYRSCKDSHDHQTITESVLICSGVMAESLSKSRHRWVAEGMFEKFWTKPNKKKGAVIEEKNNPPRDCMTKLGVVTVTIEPHVFEATMYAVKDPKILLRPLSNSRPIVQYGPPNGVVPQPPVIDSATKPFSRSTTRHSQQLPHPHQPPDHTTKNCPFPGSAISRQTTPLQLVPPQILDGESDQSLGPSISSASPSLSGLDAPVTQPSNAASPDPPALSQYHNGPIAQASSSPAFSGSLIGPPLTPVKILTPHATASRNITATGASTSTTSALTLPGEKPGSGNDPIILVLAEKAGADVTLRDLMKKVAQGSAAQDELERFQSIIDEITAERRRMGSPFSSSADQLLIDGRTVRKFADEVRSILAIVLSSNPSQTSHQLRPPLGSDPLVVLLVKRALDDTKTYDIVRRIAENRALPSDASELKSLLDQLRLTIPSKKTDHSSQSSAKGGTGTNNTMTALAATLPTPMASAVMMSSVQPQLCSKGPPPPKADMTAIVLEFAGGSGDRFLFPRFSILEHVPHATGQHCIASFLIVRKGDASIYPVANPDLDYYQPVTMRLSAPQGRLLENLTKVVASEDDVRRYMDDVMSKMTRAEYILLSMELPRAQRLEKSTDAEETKADLNGGQFYSMSDAERREVLWSTRPAVDKADVDTLCKVVNGKSIETDDDDLDYHRFVSDVSRKCVDEIRD